MSPLSACAFCREQGRERIDLVGERDGQPALGVVTASRMREGWVWESQRARRGIRARDPRHRKAPSLSSRGGERSIRGKELRTYGTRTVVRTPSADGSFFRAGREAGRDLDVESVHLSGPEARHV